MVNVTLDEYQDFVETTWKRGESPMEEELRIACSIGEESGEILGKIKKFYRDMGDPFKFQDDITKEMGDLTYYLAKMCNFYDLKLQDVLNQNVLKLTDRKERGVISGSGDNR